MLQRYKQPRTSKSNTVAAQKHLTVMYVSAGPILSVYAVLNTQPAHARSQTEFWSGPR